MAHQFKYNLMTVITHHVSDATHAWVTRESNINISIISLWYNPSGVMTLGDVVNTIENQLGQIRISHVTVRGQVIPRQDLDNHNAADHLKDKESFNCHLHLVQTCCIL